MPDRPAFERIRRKADPGYQGDPVGTVAFYGPGPTIATKVVVGISHRSSEGVHELRKWWSDGSDIRSDDTIGAEVLDFLQQHRVRSVAMSDGLLGCPHEEGIDYLSGSVCPQCPYWAGRERPFRLA